MVLLCPQRAPATTDPCRTPKLGAGPDSLNVIGNCCCNLQIYLTVNIMIPQRIEPVFTERYESVASVYYATYDDFTAAILEFFRETLPENWERIRDTVTDNFRVISTSEYKIIGEQNTHQDRQALSA